MSFLRSVLFTTPLIGLATVVMGTISLVVSAFDRSGRGPHHVARWWARMLLAVSFIRVRAEGLDRIDPGQPYVYVSNHTSFMDIPAILAMIPAQFRFFAKKGLFRIPFLGTHLGRAGHIPVERSSPRASLRSMLTGSEMIVRDRISVLIFPEGGRIEQGEAMREFREGAAYIAIKAGVPVVPIAIVGLQALLPQGSFHVRAGRGTVRIGDPIPTTGLTARDRTELTRRLFQEMAKLTAEGHDLVPQPGGEVGAGA
jgi:1-acyl-sn-glycerol-3-phosphate acyltransferase